MSRSDWCDLAKVVGLACFALGFAWLLRDYAADAGIFDYHRKPEHEQHHAAAEYCDRVRDLLIKQGFASQDATEANGSDPKQAYDYCQQWRSAEASEKAAHYTEWQALLAFFALIVSLGTLAAAAYAGYWAREAARETGRAAGAADEQAKQARAATAYAKDSAEAALAGLKIEKMLAQSNLEVVSVRQTESISEHGIFYGAGADNHLVVKITMRNSGRIQAINPRVVVHGWVWMGGAESPIATWVETDTRIAAINGGGGEDSAVIKTTFHCGDSESAAVKILQALGFQVDLFIRVLWSDAMNSIMETEHEYSGPLNVADLQQRRIRRQVR